MNLWVVRGLESLEESSEVARLSWGTVEVFLTEKDRVEDGELLDFIDWFKNYSKNEY